MNHRPTNIRWLIFVFSSVTSGMLYLHRYTWNVIRPQLEHDYGFSNTQLDQLYAFFQFSYALGSVPGGIMSDLLGAQIVLTVSTLTWSLCLVAFVFAGSYWAFGGIRLVFGLAQTATYPAITTLTKNWFALASRTTVQGFIVGSSGRIGGAISSIVMATLLMGYFGLDWRVALVIMAVLGIVFAGFLYLILRNRPESDKRVNQAEIELIREGDAAEKPAEKVISFKKALSRRNFQLLLFQQYCNAGADVVYSMVLGSLFLSKGITVAEMGIYASMPLFGGALGGFTGGMLNDVAIRVTGNRRWGRSIIGIAGKGVAAVILYFAIEQSSVAGLAWGLFFVKFFADWSMPTMMGTCTDIAGRYPATAFSMVNFTGNIGALMTPFIFGPVSDHFSTFEIIDGVQRRITDYAPMFRIVMGLYLASSFTWLFINCTKPLNADKDVLEQD